MLGVVGHESGTCHTQKKFGALSVEGRDTLKQTNEIGMYIPVLDALDLVSLRDWPH